MHIDRSIYLPSGPPGTSMVDIDAGADIDVRRRLTGRDLTRRTPPPCRGGGRLADEPLRPTGCMAD